jgi:hypothetical protein
MKLKFIIISFFVISLVYSQVNDSLRIQIVDFLIKENCLPSEKDKIQLYDESVFLTDLIHNDEFNGKNNSINYLRSTRSNSQRFIFIFCNNRFKIIGFDNLNKLLQEALFFLENIKATNEEIEKYVQRILEIYNYK